MDYWGTLPKSQSDATTIDEAITAAIASHESDPTSHVDDAKSLGLHRSNTTLDHPAASVLSDKSTATELAFDIAFQTLDGIETAGSVSVNLGLGVGVDVTAGSYDANAFYIPLPSGSSDFFRSGKDFIIQFPMVVQNDDPGTLRTGINYYTGATFHGIYFEYDGTNLKAKITLPGVTFASGVLTFDPSNLHLYRIQFIAGTGFVYWFIDGVQVASYDLSAFSGGFADSVGFEFGIGSSSEPVYYVPSLLLSGQI